MTERPLDCCVFAVRVRDEGERTAAERRVATLARFYGALGTPSTTLDHDPATRMLAGSIRFDGQKATSPFTFGGRVPSDVDLTTATDSALRALDGPFAGVALGRGHCRIVGGTGAACLYRARDAWSSHAVAASFLATGDARVDTSVLPSLIAVEFAGGERTVVAGVEALRAATCVDIEPDGIRTRSYWPAAERWAPLPEEEAYAQAASALVAAAGRLTQEEAVLCTLTDGLDSRVVALALRDAGVEFDAVTWGEPDWPDVAAAAEVAAKLGVPHRIESAEWFDEQHAVEAAIAEARWNEGGRVDFGRPVLPVRMSALVTGAGGETGRCFYYRPATVLYSRPSARTLVRQLARGPGSRLAGAEPAATAAFAAAARSWIEEAYELGAHGWRALDVVYGEHRLRRWGRHMLMRSGAPLAAPLASPPVQRALAWLPVAERASDGFHRRFVAERAPALTFPPAPPLTQRRAPPAVRRAVRAVRAGRRDEPAAGPSMWEWERHRILRAWIADNALTSELLAAALGERWLADLRRRFLAGERAAEELARWAAGPVALSEALDELRAGGTGAAVSRQDEGP